MMAITMSKTATALYNGSSDSSKARTIPARLSERP
jgi:hypothetical protein